MQLRVDVFEGGVRLTAIYGPVLTSVVLDPTDEEPVIDLLRQGFADDRAERNGHVLHE